MTKRQIIACCIGGGLFFLSYLVVGLSVIFSICAAAGGYIAGLLLLKQESKKVLSVEMSQPDLVAVEKILADASAKITKIKNLQTKINKPAVINSLKNLVTITEGIIDDIRKDPPDVKRARQFLNYYLDAVLRILTRYADLTERKISSNEATEAINKVEKLLASLEVAFQKQRAALASNDVLDLDTEISLLDKTMEMEGLKDES